MRFFVAMSVMLIACGSNPKKESSIVTEGSDTPATCCCKTIPQTAEKEITPVYAMQNRMECSTNRGDCVDDVQCNASQQATPTESDNGVPPPPPPPSTSNNGPAVP